MSSNGKDMGVNWRLGLRYGYLAAKQHDAARIERLARSLTSDPATNQRGPTP